MAIDQNLQTLFTQLVSGAQTAQQLADATGLSLEEVQVCLDKGVTDNDFAFDAATNSYTLVVDPDRIGSDPAINDELEEEIQNLGDLFECDLGEELRAKFDSEGFTPQDLRDMCYFTEQFPPMLVQVAAERGKSDLVDQINRAASVQQRFIKCIVEAANDKLIP